MNNNSVKKIIIRYAICLGVAVALTVAVLFMRDYFSQTSINQKYRFLSDGFTISGITLICVWALVFLSDEGAFDGVGYAMKGALRVIFPFLGLQKYESYKDYRDRKHEKGKAKGYSCIGLTGLVFFLIGIVFMLLFNYA